MLLAERRQAQLGRNVCVLDRAQAAAAMDERAKGFEPRARARRLGREQEAAAPEAAKADGAVGLRLGADQHARARHGLRRPVGHDQHVSIGVGEQAAWTQSVARERQRVRIAVLIGRSGAQVAGVHAVAHVAAHESGKGLDLVALLPLDEAALDRIVTVGRPVALAAVAAPEAEGQAQFPGKVGAQEIRHVGAVRLELEPLVLLLPQVVVEEILVAVRQHRLQVRPGSILVVRVVE
jgi:hypothetical protein